MQKKHLKKSNIVLVKSITSTRATNPSLNMKYTLYRNNNYLLDSVVITGSSISAYKRYVFFHTNNRLDSVLQYKANNILVSSSIATWSRNNLIGFWSLNYLYDTENRITKKIYNDGSYFRIQYYADSSVLFSKHAGVEPEYKSSTKYYDKSTKNSFKMYKYENAYAINNFVFKSIASEFTGLYPYMNKISNIYNNLGIKTGIEEYQFSGDYEGYPISIEYSFGILNYTL